MSYYVILLFFSLAGDPIETQKLGQPFQFKEDCEVFGQIKAGQLSGQRANIIPVCVQLR